MTRNNVLFIIMCIFFLYNPTGRCEIVKLSNGLNFIDINNDGMNDVIVSSLFDNNTSHPNDTLTIFIKNKTTGYNIVPLPDDDGFTWTDFKLAAATVKIRGFQLIRRGGDYYMISIYKYSNHSTYEQDAFYELPVKISEYSLNENHEDPGVPVYSWGLINTVITEQKYHDVDQAFMELFSEKILNEKK